MNEYAVCPYCNTELHYDDLTYDSFDTSTYEANWRGSCPICERIFVWKEVYSYSYRENLVEVK